MKLGLKKVYRVKYLFPKEDPPWRSLFLMDYCFKPYNERIKYFNNKEDAEHFLGVVKEHFRQSLPECLSLCTKRYFKVQTRIELARPGD